MNSDQIKTMQRRINVMPDGFWGPKSQKACREHLRRLMPDINPWPSADSGSLKKFYGDPGDESQLTTFSPPYLMYYDGKIIHKVRCHKKVAPSLERILTQIGKQLPSNPEIRDEAEDYGGCFNFRLKRGGSSYSLHAYGAAIDLDADDNTFRDSWPMQSDMPLEIMEEFAREGWISGGAFWGYDAMHFQATKG
jgi:hypothetical protein